MRTQEEIAAYIRSAAGSLFDFRREVLLEFLDFEHAKPFLKDEFVAQVEAGENRWDGTPWGEFPGYGPKSDKVLPLDPGDADFIKECMRHYMKFGWEKVEHHKGLSAGRTIDKMIAWLWLLRDYALVEFLQNESAYAQYGAPMLKAICEKYDFPIPESKKVARMSRGEKCGANYPCGCGY